MSSCIVECLLDRRSADDRKLRLRRSARSSRVPRAEEFVRAPLRAGVNRPVREAADASSVGPARPVAMSGVSVARALEPLGDAPQGAARRAWPYSGVQPLDGRPGSGRWVDAHADRAWAASALMSG